MKLKTNYIYLARIDKDAYITKRALNSGMRAGQIIKVIIERTNDSTIILWSLPKEPHNCRFCFLPKELTILRELV